MFGPPWGITPTSSCPCVVHVVSRLPPPTLRPIQTRFRFGSAAQPLNLAGDGKSPDHYAKGTPSGIPPKWHSPPTACRHVVSGSLSSPGRGSSHLSLALLGSLSVAREYLALRDGPRRFEPAFTCPALLRYRAGGYTSVAYGTVTRSGATFQMASARLLAF